MESAEPQLVAHFKTWLRKHRGASDPTIKLYARDAVLIMTALGPDPTGWRPVDVRSYVMDRARTCGNGSDGKNSMPWRRSFRRTCGEARSSRPTS